MNRVLSIFALLMLTLGTWAAQTVNVTVLPNQNAGTVTSSVDNEGKCTLTVTPAEGYYMTVENLTAVATLDGGSMQAPKRTLPINDGVLTITPDENNTDPAGVTYYTFNIEDGWNVEVTATFQSMAVYDLYIGTTRVNELNQNDVLKDGKVSFTPATDNTPATLTLNNAAITAPLKVGLANLTIDIQGENTITTSETCLQNMLTGDATPALTFTSTNDVVGSLTITNSGENSESGISSIGNVSFSRELVPVLVNYGSYTSNMYFFTNGGCKKAMIVPSYGVKVGELQVYSGNADNVLNDEGTPTVVYDVENHKLTLNGASAGVISTSLENLTIELVGNNTLSSGASYATLQSMYGDNVTMTIQSTGETKGSLTMNQPYTQAGTFADEHVTLNIVSPLAVVSGRLTGNNTNENTVVIGEGSGLIIDGYAVTEDNSEDILKDGTLSYDAETNTLTMNGATIQTGVVLCEGITSLNVVLSGNNVIEGNGFKFSESPVSLTFTTDVAEPGSLMITGEQLVTTSAAQGTTNVYYENGLVYDATEKTVSVPAISLTVGGVSVTTLTASRIAGDNISGIVSFDFESNTLTLNNATIDMTQGTGYPIESNIDDLKVLLIGSNVVKTNSNSDKAFCYTGSNANAKLTFTHETSGFCDLTVNNGSGTAYGYTVVEQEGWTVTTDPVSISYDTTYGVQIGSTAFKASALTIGTETANATFNPATGTLSLNNYTTADDITSNVANLTILLTGVNSVGTVSYSGTDAGKLTIRKNNDGNELFNELTVTSISNYTVTVDDPLVQNENVYSDARQYNLWVNGTRVMSNNMDAIATGVSFDGDHTLTLTNVNTSTNEDPFITNGLNNLTIHLVGTNTVDCGQQLFLTKDGDNNRQVTFTTDPNAAGKLMILVSEGNNWYTGHSLPTFANNLEESSSVELTVKTVTIEAPSAYYNLTIAGTQVTNLNASKVVNDNITGGTVSFDVTTNTLTLNGVKISGNIVVNRDALNVYLIGESEIEGFQNENCDLVFASYSAEGGDKLTMNNDIVVSSGYYVLFRNMLMKTQIGGKYVIALPSDYSITVNGQLITPANRLHVLGTKDETVQFDGNNKLILNNANLTSSIELGDMELLPVINGKRVLTIHLDGTTAMAGSNAKILKFTGTDAKKSEYKIVLDINSNVPGEFVYRYTGSLLSLPFSWNSTKDQILSAIFDGISVSIDDQLKVQFNLMSRTVTVSSTLTPIIPGSGSDQTDRDFASSKVSTSTLDNVVIDDILYTLNDSHTKGTNDDGFDNGQLVLNSKVSASDLEKALNYTPGTEDFAKYFKGLTFQVPGGSGIITLNDLFGEPGEFLCVKIGRGEPIKIALTETPTNYAVEYCVGSATFVYIYLPESTSSAPQMAQRRIGPKSSVAGGLGGLTVKSSSMQTGQSTANSHKEMEKSAMASSMEAVANVKDGYTCNDENITSLPDNMFVSSNTQLAPRRASADYYDGTILRKGLTFVDFSKTKITGMEISRMSGAFNGVPENVFIYVPAGNTTKDKNVVIGGICDKVELNGSTDAQPFKAMKSFSAGQAVLKREFSEGSESSKATIYLPFAVSQEDADAMGVFYEYQGINEQNQVMMKKLTSGGLKANKPYIFQAKEGGVKDPLVRVVSISAAPVETEGFKGVFERKEYEEGMYCFVGQEDGKHTLGQFVEMGQDSYVPPFRGYMIGKGAPAYAIAWDGIVDTTEDTELDVTAVETAKTVANKKVAEGWWTLNGIRLSQQPKKAGLYICDGKMVVVK